MGSRNFNYHKILDLPSELIETIIKTNAPFSLDEFEFLLLLNENSSFIPHVGVL